MFREGRVYVKVCGVNVSMYLMYLCSIGPTVTCLALSAHSVQNDHQCLPVSLFLKQEQVIFLLTASPGVSKYYLLPIQVIVRQDFPLK